MTDFTWSEVTGLRRTSGSSPSWMNVYGFVRKKPRNEWSIREIRVTHLTDPIPYQPGTMTRTGNPWEGVSGSPFISNARSVSGCSALTMGTLIA